MTIFAFPNPREAVDAILDAEKSTHWPTATISGKFPTTTITAPHIQLAWDGTPTQQVNRQNTTMRVTVWTPKGQPDVGITLAQRILAVLLDSGSATVWRFRGGPALVPGTDPSTGLPFTTFVLTAETRPAALV